LTAFALAMALLIPFGGIVLADIIETTNRKVLLKKIKKIPSDVKEVLCSWFEG
jgi:hypothetical protein